MFDAANAPHIRDEIYEHTVNIVDYWNKWFPDKWNRFCRYTVESLALRDLFHTKSANVKTPILSKNHLNELCLVKIKL